VALAETQSQTQTQSESDDIRRRMAEIRRDLHLNIQEVVSGAEAVTDGRRYIRMYPWTAVGCAVAAGYLIVPRRRRSVPRDVARTSDVAAVRQMLEAGQEPAPEAAGKTVVRSVVDAAVGMLGPLAWRVAQNYALAYLEQWIAQQQEQYQSRRSPDAGKATTQSTRRHSP
jgi:hypothetical protein